MQNINKMAEKATAASCADVRKRELILGAVYRHSANEVEIGQPLAIEQAIAEMIGSAHYLTLRLGRKQAKEIIAKLLDVL